jgi:hypothetical protein
MTVNVAHTRAAGVYGKKAITSTDPIKARLWARKAASAAYQVMSRPSHPYNDSKRTRKAVMRSQAYKQARRVKRCYQQGKE